MRQDILVEEVLAKCEVLKKAGLWPSEPTIRPRAWIGNFDSEDRGIAAQLLDKFTFYDRQLTDALLIASYHSIGDGYDKGPVVPLRNDLITALDTAIFIPVTGEVPNPTDSGYLICRRARQMLSIPESRVLEPEEAMKHAEAGGTVVFLDDFVGSGDQFLKTWKRKYGRSNPSSFLEVQTTSGFTAIYITLVSTHYGLDEIHRHAPTVAVCVTHILEERSTVRSFKSVDAQLAKDIDDFLIKYSSRLTPKEDYMSRNQQYLAFGYKKRGLLFGFEHSIPDATLPIFWSPGNKNWEPLVERT